MSDISKMSIAELQSNALGHSADIGVHQAIVELARRLEAAEAKAATMLEELDVAWSFDNDQRHTHTWHTKQDFLDKWRSTDAARGVRGE